jgi:hypothetical protein
MYILNVVLTLEVIGNTRIAIQHDLPEVKGQSSFLPWLSPTSLVTMFSEYQIYTQVFVSYII